MLLGNRKRGRPCGVDGRSCVAFACHEGALGHEEAPNPVTGLLYSKQTSRSERPYQATPTVLYSTVEI